MRLCVPEATATTTQENGRFYEGTHVSLDPRFCYSFDHLIAKVKAAFNLDPERYQDTLWHVYCVLEGSDAGLDGSYVHLSKLHIFRDTPADAIRSYLCQAYTFYFEEDPRGQSSYGIVYQ